MSFILENRPLDFEDKLTAKKLGRPTPVLDIKKTTTSKSRQFNRYFNVNVYDKFPWMCGCPERNKLFCFVCILSNSLQPSPWIQQGVDDLRHLQERAKKHEKSACHIHHLVDFNVLGKTSIRTQLDSAYRQSIRAHNEKVDKNRHILRRLIMCIKFCGAFELALRGHDENKESQNRGIFRGLVDFTAELDLALSVHLNESTVFKGTSKTIQNELLDAMLQVCKNEIRDQITQSNFLAIEADETTDSFNQQQLVIIFRYVFKGELFERFWNFCRPEGYTAEVLAGVIMNELDDLNIPINKLIAQSYDGAAVMSGKTSGVQSRIKAKYTTAFYIHCYAHQFNLILEKAATCNKKLKIFFAELQSFSSFFSRSTQRTSVLDEIVKQRLPRAVVTRWNFKTRIVNTVYDKKALICECLEKLIETERDSKTISEANGLLTILNRADFNYFLEVIHYITPHVEIFFNQVQNRKADSVYIQKCLKTFECQITEIRQNKIDQLQLSEETNVDFEGPSLKRLKTTASENNRVVAKEYCDVIISQIRERFDFTCHLSAAKLFCSDLLATYRENFPEQIFTETVESYSCLDKEKLRTELQVIYQRADMQCDGVLPLLNFLNKNNLQDGLSETCKLLDIICTTPMTTSECERCFSTLKRIKSFLRNTMGQERLNALAMLSIEKQLVQSIPDFDNKVINLFATKKERRMDFNYKCVG